MKPFSLPNFVTKKKVPKGVVLSPDEVVKLAEKYDKDASVVEGNISKIEDGIEAINDSLPDLPDKLGEITAIRNRAVGYYKRTDNPVRKQEWARRVVVADRAINQFQTTKRNLKQIAERLAMLKGDLELELITAQIKATEARAYANTGQQLHLAGRRLMEARAEASTATMEYTNLEISMGGLENEINNESATAILAQAEAIANRTKLDIEDDQIS